MLSIRDESCKRNNDQIRKRSAFSGETATLPSTSQSVKSVECGCVTKPRKATASKILRLQLLVSSEQQKSQESQSNAETPHDEETVISEARVDDMRDLNQKLCKRIRRVNEKQVNKLLNVAPDLNLGRLFRKPLPAPNKTKRSVQLPLPNTLRSIVRELGLLDEPDRRARVRLFAARCLALGYTYRTTDKYYQLLKRVGVFDLPNGQTVSLRPDKFAFAESGKMHVRPVSKQSFAKLVTHLHRNFSEYTAPLLVAVYTGLRTFEILQWNTSTLRELRDKQTLVAIIRKQTVVRDTARNSFLNGNSPASLDEKQSGYDDHSDQDQDDHNLCSAHVFDTEDRATDSYWRPVYTSRLLWFVDRMMELYRDAWLNYERTGLPVMLFNVGPSTLVNRMRTAFYQANGFMPPYGFGIHSCRNMLAEIMSERTDSMTSIQAFLQHRSISTSRRYVHADFNYVREEFDRITKHEMADVKRSLDSSEAVQEAGKKQPVDLLHPTRDTDAEEEEIVTRRVNEMHEDRTRWLMPNGGTNRH